MGSFNYHSGVNWNLVLDAEQLLISQVIERRNIRWLCHFTPRSNLENIKQNGLKTRDQLFYGEVKVTDPSRYDQYSNAICLSISQPNKWMFNKKQEQGFDLCLLLINPEVLYRKKCLFYPHNAATASYRNINVESLKGENALENMFANPISFQKSGKAPQDIFRFHYLLDCEATSDQAEVQCLENIELQYIKHVFEEDIPLTYYEILNQMEPSKGFYPSIQEQSQLVKESTERKSIRELFPHLDTQAVISDIGTNKWKNSKTERWNDSSLESELESKKEKIVLETQKKDENYSKPEPDIADLLGLLDRVVDKTLDGVDKALYKVADKADEFLEKDKPKKNNSSNSSSSGDGCLVFIILIILIIIFVL
ncbi:DarT ssDNA thymidine ADP-ribosyltransferase family protein [Aggregatibacter kilianii]|uniref:DarT ssDNA thymidine ADP-ribosyltransferase family protein n=1 Tax=Aggregatibacter kilianii TaxID=2025884 RepID=UPI000D651B3A|nr:DarT ssDNA thymidine ADP-ribosyltransferase family protein [Aggregatibacter kilianii]